MPSRDFLSLLDLSPTEVHAVLELAAQLHDDFRAGALPQALKNRSIALIWDAEGFRNRAAFELGIARMGGTAVVIPGRLDERESIEDVAQYLDNWFDAIIVRTRDDGMVRRLAAAAKAPVINARTAHNHPCEVLGDLAFVRSQRGQLRGLNVAFFGGATNLCHSWFEAAARLPIHVVQVCPAEDAVDPGWLSHIGLGGSGRRLATQDIEASLHNADVVYTDTWPVAATPLEQRHIAERFAPYQITAARLALAKPDTIFLPCPPVHRGEEVSDDAMTSPLCRVYEAKDHLLHAQNALLVALFSDLL